MKNTKSFLKNIAIGSIVSSLIFSPFLLGKPHYINTSGSKFETASLEELSAGDSALIRTLDGTTHNIVISKISNTALGGSFPKVASSSSRGKLTEYGKQKTEKLRSQTLRSETVRLNIVDIKDVEITSKIKKVELDEEQSDVEALKKAGQVAGAAVGATAAIGVLVAGVAAVTFFLPMLLFAV